MAIIKCSECGQEISDTTKKCIHCGAAVSKRKNNSSKKTKWIVIFLGIFVLLAGILGISYFTRDDNEEVVQTNQRDASKNQVEIITDFVNIRKDKDINSEILGKVYYEEIYTVLSEDNSDEYNWLEIETNNGIRGYISGNEDYVLKYYVVDNQENSDDNSDNTISPSNPSTNTQKPATNNQSSNNQTSNNNTNNNSNSGNSSNNSQLNVCTKTCTEGYVLKNPNSAGCYCEKSQEKNYVANNQVIYSGNGVTITLRGLDYTPKGWVTVDIVTTNDSDVAKTVQLNNIPFVNNHDIAANYSVTLLPGTSSSVGFNFLKSYLEKDNITVINSIKMNFRIVDWDGTPETLHGAATYHTPWIEVTF